MAFYGNFMPTPETNRYITIFGNIFMHEQFNQYQQVTT